MLQRNSKFPKKTIMPRANNFVPPNTLNQPREYSAEELAAKTEDELMNIFNEMSNTQKALRAYSNMCDIAVKRIFVALMNKRQQTARGKIIMRAALQALQRLMEMNDVSNPLISSIPLILHRRLILMILRRKKFEP